MVRNVRVIQLDPEAQSLGQFLPLLHVLPNALLAFLDEGFDTELFDVLFGVDAHLLADFHLDGQSMRIPARFAFAVETLHRFVAREEILHRSGQAVTGMRFAVGGWWAFEENVLRSVFALFECFVVNLLVPPELKNLLFLFRETDVVFSGIKLRHGGGIRSGIRLLQSDTQVRRLVRLNRYLISSIT